MNRVNARFGKVHALGVRTYDSDMGPRAPGIGRSTATTLVVALALLLTGCTYSQEEPGLFGLASQAPPTEPGPSQSPEQPLPPTNPELPVAGEAVWTSAEGLEIQLRLAVHAIRRVDGGTVLDWSVTPLGGPNLRPGDTVPTWLELGLSAPPGSGTTNILLIDAENRDVYRPLYRATAFETCLCTPLRLAPRNLRVGVTALLQIAFPELPARVRAVDVAIPTVPLFGQIPVTKVGTVPVATGPIELSRPAEAQAAATSTQMFRYGSDEQIFRLQVRRVVAGRTFTTLEWAIVSITGGNGVTSASQPPISAGTGVGDGPAAASGPVIQYGPDAVLTPGATPSGVKTLRPQLITRRQTSAEARVCLCSDLRGWTAALRRPDKVATVVTTFPALPAGTQQVRVAFPGLPPMDAPVIRAPTAGTSTAQTVGDLGTWSGRSRPSVGWDAGEWPTPVPSRRQLDRYTVLVDRLVS